MKDNKAFVFFVIATVLFVVTIVAFILGIIGVIPSVTDFVPLSCIVVCILLVISGQFRNSAWERELRKREQNADFIEMQLKLKEYNII